MYATVRYARELRHTRRGGYRGAVPEKKRKSSNATLALGLAGMVGVVGLAFLGMKVLTAKKPPPPAPPPPPPAANLVTGNLKFTQGFYKAQVDDDLKTFGLGAMSLADVAAPLAYYDELDAPRKLKAEKDTVETPHLRITTKVQKEWATQGSGQGFKFEHAFLEITNKTDKHLAYRVLTRVEQPERCKSKGAVKHNAIALAPGQTVRRTECLWRKDLGLTLARIEVLELTKLGYFYVSRLLPAQVLLDERTAAGHEVPKGKQCAFVPWREISSMAGEKSSWGDVMDFYARHNCDEYAFYRGYHRWSAPGTLPSYATAGGGTASDGPAPTASAK